MLLAKNADVNKQDIHENTALARAAKYRRIIVNLEKKQKFTNMIGQLLASDADQQVKCKTTGRLELDLKEYLQDMRKQTSGILKKEVPKLPNELAILISEFTY